MKNLIVGMLFCLSTLSASANDFDVLPGEVWVYPTLVSQSELWEERGGKNHSLNVKFQIDQTTSRSRAEALRAQYPRHEVKLYRVDFVEGSMALPNVQEKKLNFTERMDGWDASLSYVHIPHEHLQQIKETLNQVAPIKVVVSHWKNSMVEHELLKESCTTGTGNEEGVSWMIDRLFGIEKKLTALESISRTKRRELLSQFFNTCVAIDLAGMNSFKQVLDESQQWRLRPTGEVFRYTEAKRESNYVRQAPLIENRVKFHQY